MHCAKPYANRNRHRSSFSNNQITRCEVAASPLAFARRRDVHAAKGAAMSPVARWPRGHQARVPPAAWQEVAASPGRLRADDMRRLWSCAAISYSVGASRPGRGRRSSQGILGAASASRSRANSLGSIGGLSRESQRRAESPRNTLGTHSHHVRGRLLEPVVAIRSIVRRERIEQTPPKAPPPGGRMRTELLVLVLEEGPDVPRCEVVGSPLADARTRCEAPRCTRSRSNRVVTGLC